MKKYLIITWVLLLGSAHAGFWDDEDSAMGGSQSQFGPQKKQIEQPTKPMPMRKPLKRPPHLSPLEQSILDTFERQLAPLADQLGALTASPEARQAREEKIKEWEQKIKEASRRRPDEGGRRWWAPDDGYRPSRSGGFGRSYDGGFGGGFGGGGFGGSALPRYWTPPTSWGDGAHEGQGTQASPGDHGDHRTSPLTMGHDHDDEDREDSSDESSGKVKKTKGGTIFDPDRYKKSIESYDKAISLLTNAVKTIEDLKLIGNPDNIARQLLEQETIKGIEKTVADAYDAEKLISNDIKQTLTPKNEEWKKQSDRLTGAYTKLLPFALRAATIDTNENDEQKNIKKFIEKRIAPKISLQAYNTALRERESQLLDELAKQPDITRSPATVEQINEKIGRVQAFINRMPRGLDDAHKAGREHLEKNLNALKKQKADAEMKAAAVVKKAAVKAPAAEEEAYH